MLKGVLTNAERHEQMAKSMHLPLLKKQTATGETTTRSNSPEPPSARISPQSLSRAAR
jgi:hypothetical protein